VTQTRDGRLGDLPHDDALGVIHQVLAHPRQVRADADARGGEHAGRPDAGQLQQARRVDGPGADLEIPFMSTELYTGPAASAMNGTDLSWIVGLVVTVPLYYLLAVRQRARRPAAVPEPARN